jgi:type IV fimbrial biogenesis protein FimT
MRFRRFQSGFTLVELVITVAIAGVLLGIGIPNFQNFVKNNRMVAQTNEILADLNYTRSEALKRSRNVHICKTTNPKAATPVCNPTAGDAWTTGWLIWADENGNNTLDNTPVNELLRINEGASGTVTIKTAAPIQNEVIFTKLGLLSNAGGTFNICDDRGSPKGRQVTVTTTGRPAFSRNPSCI